MSDQLILLVPLHRGGRLARGNALQTDPTRIGECGLQEKGMTMNDVTLRLKAYAQANCWLMNVIGYL